MLQCSGTCVGAGVGGGWGRVAHSVLDPRFLQFLCSCPLGRDNFTSDGEPCPDTPRPDDRQLVCPTWRSQRGQLESPWRGFSPSGMVNEWQLDCWKALKILLMNWPQARWAEAQGRWCNADPVLGWPEKEVGGFRDAIPVPAQSTRGDEIIQGPETLLWLEQNPVGPLGWRTCLIWSKRPENEWYLCIPGEMLWGGERCKCLLVVVLKVWGGIC